MISSWLRRKIKHFLVSVENNNIYCQSFFHQLMHTRIALKVVLKFTLKQLQHVSA